VIGSHHLTTTKDLCEAVQWAADNGADVINLSLAYDFPGLVRSWANAGMPVELATSRALAQYRDNLRFMDSLVAMLRAGAARGTSPLIVAAAGNESRRDVQWDHTIEAAPPAAAEGVVAVAALQS
jgi:subtilisin family serine protease